MKSIFLRYGTGVKVYRIFDRKTLRVSSIAEMSSLTNQHLLVKQGRKGVGNQPLVEIECQNISRDYDDNSQKVTGPQKAWKIRKGSMLLTD